MLLRRHCLWPRNRSCLMHLQCRQCRPCHLLAGQAERQQRQEAAAWQRSAGGSSWRQPRPSQQLAAQELLVLASAGPLLPQPQSLQQHPSPVVHPGQCQQGRCRRLWAPLASPSTRGGSQNLLRPSLRAPSLQVQEQSHHSSPSASPSLLRPSSCRCHHSRSHPRSPSSQPSLQKPTGMMIVSAPSQQNSRPSSGQIAIRDSSELLTHAIDLAAAGRMEARRSGTQMARLAM